MSRQSPVVHRESRKVPDLVMAYFFGILIGIIITLVVVAALTQSRP